MHDEQAAALRKLPAVSRLLETPTGRHLVQHYGHALTVAALREALDAARQAVRAGMPPPTAQAVLEQAAERLRLWTRPSLQPVINATGVLLHTNLGRAPLSTAARAALDAIAAGYSNLEYDLRTGRRGSRLHHASALLTRLTGAEAALVVNNNAAAVMLALAALARRRRVLVARTQLVEIGGGFRIPEVLAQSGAKLVEVGTTNRVHLRDYEQALQEQPIAALLWVHRSNFRIVGFHTEPNLAQLAALAHEHNIPLVADLGSGALLDTARYGLEHEPTVAECLQDGADLVCFSGDKLLGGPQAGIIVGRADLIKRLQRHPLARALRADKLALAALSATLQAYLTERAEQDLPLWAMLARSPATLRQVVEGWRQALGTGEVRPGFSTLGGGSLPGAQRPTYLLALPGYPPQRLLRLLREQSPPIVARIEDDAVVLDPRTVLPDQEPALLHGVRQALTSLTPHGGTHEA